MFDGEGSHLKQTVTVLDLSQKQPTYFKVGDQVISIEGYAVRSVAELKVEAKIRADSKSVVSIEILRDGVRMSISEPLITISISPISLILR